MRPNRSASTHCSLQKTMPRNNAPTPLQVSTIGRRNKLTTVTPSTLVSHTTHTIANNLSVEINNQCVLEAAQSITLKVGNTVLLLNADGIYIQAANLQADK